MSNTVEELRRELQAAQRALAEINARSGSHGVEHQPAAKDLENARRKVEQAHHEWMAALDAMTDPIFLHDKEFRILRCNRAYQQRAGISFKQIIGQPYYEIFPKIGAPLPGCLRVMKKTEEAEAAEEVQVGDTIYRSRVFSVKDIQGVYLYSVHTLEDITARKGGETEIIAARNQLQATLGAIPDMMFDVGLDGRFYDYHSPHNDLQYSLIPQAFLGKTVSDIVPPAAAEVCMSVLREANEKGVSIGKQYEMQLPQGKFWFELSVSRKPGERGQEPRFIAIMRDITDSKQKEAELRLAADRLNEAERIGKLGSLDWDLITNEIEVSDEALRVFGLAPGRTRFKLEEITELVHPDDVEHVLKSLRDAIEKGSGHDIEHRIVRADGTLVYVHTLAEVLRDASGKSNRLLGTVHDITGRKRAEVAIQHANRALATLSAVNHNLVHATDENELLRAICKAIVLQRGYQLAWVGYAQHDEHKSIKIMAYASDDGGYLDTMQPTWAEEERGMGPSGRAVRSGATQLCQDIANDPHYSPWRDEALKRGYAASIALPLMNGDNTVFGTLAVYAEEVNAFIPSEINLLEEMAADLAFGVRSLRIRQERDFALEQNQLHLAQVQDSLENTVRAIASIVEMRDPYTAGHQVRVADLAAAIARQMGLPDEQIHAIHLAGVVHDLGKIKVPAEILSKPGKITDLEFGLIKVHPQAGYDILKGINFPWPIAQMVLQHHERLDESGYPQGLKGGDILLEARILSVADVVEAMYSHRPYRPGLGIEAALAEITKRRGIYFDTQVVDACLVLFREQGYHFK